MEHILICFIKEYYENRLYEILKNLYSIINDTYNINYDLVLKQLQNWLFVELNENYDSIYESVLNPKNKFFGINNSSTLDQIIEQDNKDNNFVFNLNKRNCEIIFFIFLEFCKENNNNYKDKEGLTEKLRKELNIKLNFNNLKRLKFALISEAEQNTKGLFNVYSMFVSLILIYIFCYNLSIIEIEYVKLNFSSNHQEGEVEDFIPLDLYATYLMIFTLTKERYCKMDYTLEVDIIKCYICDELEPYTYNNIFKSKVDLNEIKFYDFDLIFKYINQRIKYLSLTNLSINELQESLINNIDKTNNIDSDNIKKLEILNLYINNKDYTLTNLIFEDLIFNLVKNYKFLKKISLVIETDYLKITNEQAEETLEKMKNNFTELTYFNCLIKFDKYIYEKSQEDLIIKKLFYHKEEFADIIVAQLAVTSIFNSTKYKQLQKLPIIEQLVKCLVKKDTKVFNLKFEKI